MAGVKSQVSLFIVVGLVILLFLAFLIFSINPQLSEKTLDDSAIYYMESCIEDKAFESLIMAGKTGGKFESDVSFTSNIKISELFTLSELEKKVENYFLSSVKSCTEENISGKKIFMNQTDVSVSLGGRVFFDISDAYSVFHEDGVYHHGDMSFDFNIRFDEIYGVIEHILENKPDINDTGPMRIEGFKIEFIELSDYIICVIEDKQSSRDYLFTFAFEK